ncbi:MAG: hypothetical protein ACKV2Q_28360, partial [Planctomycetaceae bacterium]
LRDQTLNQESHPRMLESNWFLTCREPLKNHFGWVIGSLAVKTNEPIALVRWGYWASCRQRNDGLQPGLRLNRAKKMRLARTTIANH